MLTRLTKTFSVILIALILSPPSSCSSPGISGMDMNMKMVKLFSSGPISIFWDGINGQNLKYAPTISDGCVNGIELIKSNLRNGSKWAFEFLDASAKGISGHLEVTLSSFGDYDQCLSIKTDTDITSQHCMVNFIYTNESAPNSMSDILSDAIQTPGNQQMFFSYGLCFPNSCSESEIKKLITDVLSADDYPIKIKDDYPLDTIGVTCTSAKDDSWIYKLDPRNMTKAQMLSLLFILSILSIVNISTNIQVIELIVNKFLDIDIYEVVPEEVHSAIKFTRHFSIINSAKDLLSVSSLEGRSFAPDSIKVGVVLAGILAHASIYLESNLGFLTVTRINILWKVFGNLGTQIINSPGSFELFDVSAGFLVVYGLYDAIKDGRFNILKSFVSRYIRHLPTLLVLLALDFLWPIFTPSGPLVEMAAREVIGKCSRHWWRPLTMMANTMTLSDSCIMHTFYAAVDFQLFAIGVAAIVCFTKSEKFGYTFCALGSVVGSVLLYINAKDISTPVMIEAYPVIAKTHDFFHKVHFPAVGHIHNYILGIVIGYKIKQGWRLYQPSRTTFVMVNGASFALLLLSHYSAAIHNIFNLVPFHLFPLFIIVNKMIYGALWGVIAITVCHYHQDLASLGRSTIREALIEGRKLTDAEKDEDGDKKKKDENRNQIIEFDVSLIMKWLTKVLGQLAFSAHMVNLIYLRTSFMTTKVHLSLDPLSVATRMLLAGVNCMIIGLFFHLFFCAPFDSLRNSYLRSGGNKIKPNCDKDGKKVN